MKTKGNKRFKQREVLIIGLIVLMTIVLFFILNNPF